MEGIFKCLTSLRLFTFTLFRQLTIHYQIYNLISYIYFFQSVIYLWKEKSFAPAKIQSKVKLLNNRSFTLLEVILAIAVLTAATAGVFSLIIQTFASASLNQSKLVAAYLAQEGLEIIRNIRDSNWLAQIDNGGSWRANKLDPQLSAANYVNEVSYDYSALTDIHPYPQNQTIFKHWFKWFLFLRRRYSDKV
jgi:type II secretory pathway pseudopilin PulG